MANWFSLHDASTLRLACMLAADRHAGEFCKTNEGGGNRWAGGCRSQVTRTDGKASKTCRGLVKWESGWREGQWAEWATGLRQQLWHCGLQTHTTGLHYINCKTFNWRNNGHVCTLKSYQLEKKWSNPGMVKTCLFADTPHCSLFESVILHLV